jgi:hypothetical protein
LEDSTINGQLDIYKENEIVGKLFFSLGISQDGKNLTKIQLNMRDYGTVTESSGQGSSLLRESNLTLEQILQARKEYEKTMLEIFPNFPV